MRRAIAQTQHPYSPQGWLSKQQVEAILQEDGITTTCTLTFCKQCGLSLGGHDSALYIYKISLDQWLSRRKHDRLENDVIYQAELIEICRKEILQYRADTSCVESLHVIHYRLQKRLNLSLEELRPFYSEASRILEKAEDW
jgi:hypothetical protein